MYTLKFLSIYMNENFAIFFEFHKHKILLKSRSWMFFTVFNFHTVLIKSMAYLASSVALGGSIDSPGPRRYLFVAIKTGKAALDLNHHFISIIWNTFNDFCLVLCTAFLNLEILTLSFSFLQCVLAEFSLLFCCWAIKQWYW